MDCYLGIDIGTSGTKAVCFDKDGKVVASAYAEYELLTIRTGYSEERPSDWWEAVKKTIKDITKAGFKIKGIGLSGQMHGLVILDKEDKVLRNSIIWCDNRAILEAEELASNFGNERLKAITGNEVVPAFTLAKLLWVKNNEPDIYRKINKVMLPKDYIRYMLTKEFKTEYSDASGMQMLDIYKKEFSKEILDYLKLPRTCLPILQESVEISGYITKENALELGLSDECFVVGGAGDQAAAALGNGIVSKGEVSIVLGSSGVVFSPILKEDLKTNNLQVFMHAVPNTYHVMGVTNGCGLSYKWFKENLGAGLNYEELNQKACSSKPLSNGLIYLPYLNGERTPYLDPYASGTFIGVRQNTSLGDFTRAILEGVAFSLKDCFSMLPKVEYKKVLVSGGGANGKLWRSIIASCLNMKISRLEQSEGGALGVAILAMVADGVYSSIDEAVVKIIHIKDNELPNEAWVKDYKDGYLLYKEAYMSLKTYYKKAFKE